MSFDRVKRHIKQFESFRPEAYPDAGYGWRIPTIGWGRTEGVYRGELTTIEAEEEWLDMKLDYLARSIKELTTPLTPGQLDALISFVYNCGLGAFQRSTLRRRLNAGDLAGAAAEFPRWIRSNGKVMRGLMERRGIERSWFES